MAARVLKGEDVKNIPYETLTESKITINTDAAEKSDNNTAVNHRQS